MEMAEFQRAARRSWYGNLAVAALLLAMFGVFLWWKAFTASGRSFSSFNSSDHSTLIMFVFLAALPLLETWHQWRLWQRTRRLTEVPSDEERDLTKARDRLRGVSVSAVLMSCLGFWWWYGNRSSAQDWVLFSVIPLTCAAMAYRAWRKLRELQHG